jgi:anti-sigma factor ChrR (cupin superfamily)
MTRNRVDESVCDRAAAYAIGALDGDEARAFVRHLETGCASCRADVDAFAVTAAQAALAPAPRAPGPGVRSRLLADLARGDAFHFQLASEGTWNEIRPGAFRKDVGDGAPGGHRSYLIRLEPGAAVAPHAHAAVEHCHVLAGDLHVAGRHLHAGDYHRAAPGTVHDVTLSDTGCLLLIVEAPV